jgi:phosphoribosylformylglycinamidine synthase
MLNFFRTPALSEEKTARALAEIKAIAPEVSGLKTETCFYVDVKEPLNEVENEHLKWLLAETFEPEKFGVSSFLPENGKIMVGPRKSRLTQWSTSAQAIFNACLLGKINRVEASINYRPVFLGEQISLTKDQQNLINAILHDPLTEEIYESPLDTFESGVIPEPVQLIPLLEKGKDALVEEKFKKKYGLRFTADMTEYICNHFINELKRNPTDVELFTVGQLNSEHCRHHIFNGIWTIDGVVQEQTLMDMIRGTVKNNPGNLEVAFKDNAAVLRPVLMKALIASNPETSSQYKIVTVRRGFVLKVETHNHPTTVCPYPGAATGVAVRRDIFGTGRGAVSVAHLAGYYVGNLFIPGYIQPWEKEYVPYSPRFAKPLKIKIEGSNGASDNCNCFGNPVLLGTARSFEQLVGTDEKVHYGWRKTGMVAGSFGWIDARHIEKRPPEKGMLIVQTGGPATKTGVGGGGGSSNNSGAQELIFDFNSVQRDDGFTERGNFNVVRACSELGEKNPIVTVTDLGAGGDCVAPEELVFPEGAKVYLYKIPSGDKTMTDCVWYCNEAQERMVYLIWAKDLPLFMKICNRHRCHAVVIGEVTGDGKFVLIHNESPEAPREQQRPIDLDMEWMLGDLPQKSIVCASKPRKLSAPRIPLVEVIDHLNRVFRLLDIGSKEYLTKKADRTVGNRSARQQEVGFYQLPLADCAVVSDGPFGKTGNVVALGEQPIKGLVDNEAGVRLSIGEGYTNVIWAPMIDLSELNHSVTWQWSCGQPGEDARLHQAVRAATRTINAVRSRIGVGKDSNFMTLEEILANSKIHPVLAPGTVQMVVFGPCCDINHVITPDLKMPGESKLMFIDLARGKTRLGGSALLRVYEQIGDVAPDMDDPELFFSGLLAMQKLIQWNLVQHNLILSGHDRSDGGLIGCCSEMAFAGNCGLRLDLQDRNLGSRDRDELLFNEELGLVIEYLPKNYEMIRGVLRRFGIGQHCHVIGETVEMDRIEIRHNRRTVLRENMSNLRAIWRETSFRLDAHPKQASPKTVAEERENTFKRSEPKLNLTFEPRRTPNSVMLRLTKPKLAILLEAGANGDRDAAETFHLAGFETQDVCVNDLISGEATFKDYQKVFVPGGFTFHDAMDAGKGEAGVFRFNPRLAEEFYHFTQVRTDTLLGGNCNGCQALTLLGILPQPGMPTEKMPRFITNKSERFEHRLVTVGILPGSNCVYLKDMEGSRIPIIISHAQGRFHADQDVLDQILADDLAPIRYLDDEGKVTEKYPFNPNGSPLGIAGLSSRNGRILVMMPHYERLPLLNLFPWLPLEWKKLKASPWTKISQNAREWCEQS